MDKTIRGQLEAIRRSGETNMLDVDRVQRIADREGFYELVVFIEEHRSEYINFIFYGDADGGETTDRIEHAEETAAGTEDAEDIINTTGAVHETVAYHYGLTGQKRKELVEAISKFLDTPAIYQKAPTFAYRIGDHIVDRDGTLSYTSSVSPTEAQRLVLYLQEQGFVAKNTGDTLGTPTRTGSVTMEEDEEETVAGAGTADTAVAQTGEMSGTTNASDTPTDSENPEADSGTAPETDGGSEKPESLIVEIPKSILTDAAYLNLQKIIASRATLLKQALGTETLKIEKVGEKFCFPWFTLHGLEGEADAYTRLITAMVEMAKRQKRVLAVEKPVENAKFTMRIFLIRLGFIGDEYKAARKILLRNLSGNSSWKAGHRPEKLAEDRPTIPPDPETASSYIPTDTETVEIPEDIYADHPDTLPEDKGGAPYDK